MPTAFFKMVNFMLMRFLIVMLNLRLFFKQQVLAMVDPKFAVNFKINRVLPKMNRTNASNVKQIFNFM